MKPICVNCRRFFRPKRTGQDFIEAMPTTGGTPPRGLAAPEKWAPYKIWFGDVWACPDCGATIIVGVAREPYRMRHHADFREELERMGAAAIQINDC